LGKLLVDNGSSVDIIFVDAFDKMGLNKDLLQHPDTSLYGFGRRVIHALGKVVLLVSFGTVRNARTEYLSFDIVEMYYPYNSILGRRIPQQVRSCYSESLPMCEDSSNAGGHHNSGSPE
jgi:hypothetical protein